MAYNVDQEAGSPQEWWKTVIHHLMVNPDLTNAELGKIVDRAESRVVRVRNCTAFKSMFAEAKALAGNLPAAQEAASGLVGKGKLTFTHSKGELDNRAREVLMEVLSNEEMRDVFNKKGEIIGHEPVVPLLEKGKIAASLFLGLHQKAPNFIKNQQNNVVVTGGAADDIDPALLEVFTAVQRSVPMRLVEKGASVQVIAKIEGQDVLVGKVEDGE